MNSVSLRCAACCRLRVPVSTSGFTNRCRIARSKMNVCSGSFAIRTPSVVEFTVRHASSEICGKQENAAASIEWQGSMRRHKIRAIRGYKAPRPIAGRPSILAPNRLNREFTVDTPDRVWVTDITYLRTWQGWLYLAVVMDLYARKIIGWSMKPTLARELVLDALLMALWRRKPRQRVVVHSDQGTQ